MNTDNIDRFGHCSFCHKNMIVSKVVDGKVTEMFLPEHDHVDFLLNSGSIMKVCLCKNCKKDIDLNDPTVRCNIMEAVMKGWELETKILVADEKLPDWTQEYADKYLDTMGQLNIDCHADNLAHSFLQKRSQELFKSFCEKDKECL